MGNCMGNATFSSPPPPVNTRASRLNNNVPAGEQNRTRQVLFEPGVNEDQLDLSKIIIEKKIDVETKLLIQRAIGKVFGEEDARAKLKTIIGVMEKATVGMDKVIITEGEPGDKLYIIEKGEMEITINNKVVRSMVRGDMVGELALLYDAPRSATVRTLTECVVWTLSREHFKVLQAASTSAQYLQRAKWLITSTDLATLTQLQLSRLIGVLQVVKYKKGDTIYIEGENTDHVVLLESGKCLVSSSHAPASLSLEEKDKVLGIVRNKAPVGDIDESFDGADPNNIAVEVTEDGYMIEAGCILGMNGLRAKAGLDTAGAWVWNKETHTTASPLTVVAESDVDALFFTRKVFENLFGSNSLLPINKKASIDKSERSLKKFEPSKFKMKHVLGSGSFGVVVYAESREDPSGKTHYALKFLSKVDVVVTGQLKHVEDEKRLLAMMESPFILKLYGTYQTPHQIVLVTESINNGDMWSVIYEQFYNKGGLPPKLVTFYSASIVLALSHIHSKGMAYRDLKPENIMIDSKGYAKIIDFGFAKTIPYTKKDEATGESKVYAKSYTLCGTPEYLAPEFVFNLGHDHSADLWALGVMIYEMYMTVTPFAPKRVDNITELFNNIAQTKTSGVKIPPKLDERAKTKLAGDVILKLLRPQPSERFGVQEGYTSVILEHEFYKDVDSEGLIQGSVVPVFIPAAPSSHAPMSSLPAIKAFKGDQTQFEFF